MGAGESGFRGAAAAGGGGVTRKQWRLLHLRDCLQALHGGAVQYAETLWKTVHEVVAELLADQQALEAVLEYGFRDEKAE